MVPRRASPVLGASRARSWPTSTPGAPWPSRWNLDLHKPDNAQAYPATATRAWIGNREPYLRRGAEGSQRYLVAVPGELAARWWPVASGMPWGDIRSAGIAPSPGARHPSGDTYEAVPGPDPVRYPADGTVLMTNVIVLDEAGIEALIADGAHGADDRPVTAGDADLPDDDGRCPRVAAWLEGADFTGATSRDAGPVSRGRGQ